MCSKALEGMARELIQLALEIWISGAISELVAQVRPREPTCTASVGHDACDRLPMYGKRHPLTGPHGVEHTARLVAQIPNTNIHVRRRSIGLADYCVSRHQPPGLPRPTHVCAQPSVAAWSNRLARFGSEILAASVKA